MESGPRNAVVEALLAGEEERVALGLERLLQHYRLNDTLEKRAIEFGLEVNVRNPSTAMLAWSMVGPKIANNNKVFNGIKAGAPKKHFNGIDQERALFVRKIKAELTNLNINMSDAEVIAKLQEMTEPEARKLFSKAITLERLKNSVARGNISLDEERRIVSELLSRASR